MLYKLWGISQLAEEASFSSRTVLHGVCVFTRYKQSWPNASYYPGTCLAGLRKTVKSIIQLISIWVKIWILYLQIQVQSSMVWASLSLSSRINEVGISEQHLKCVPYMWSILPTATKVHHNLSFEALSLQRLWSNVLPLSSVEGYWSWDVIMVHTVSNWSLP